MLVGLWAAGLILGFALLHASVGTVLTSPGSEGAEIGFFTYVYFSGTTFFTLGYGDLVPTGQFGRGMSVIEAGVGFSFLAVVISYLPILYQAFSRREIVISLLDARAGSPPSAGELLRRAGEALQPVDLGAMLAPTLVEWEHWSAELLESHLSYPVLRFYRSQHDNQSWVGALTTILDTCSVLIAGIDESVQLLTWLTFAMARHAAVDLGLVSETGPAEEHPRSTACQPNESGARPLATLPGSGHDDPGRGGVRSNTHGVAWSLRAVRAHDGDAARIFVAAVSAEPGSGRQLADESGDAALAGAREIAGDECGRTLRLRRQAQG